MKFKLDISGMSCEHCVNYVKKVLSQEDGVNVLQAEIGTAVIDIDGGVSETKIKDIIEDAGYELNSILPYTAG